MKLIKIGTLLLVGVLLTSGLSLSAQDLKVLDKPWVK